MDADDLRRLVALGEGPHLEFKYRVPRPDRIAREVIALANTGGGTVLIGVGDDGELVGVKDAEEEQFALEEALRTFCEPSLDVGIHGVRVSRRREVLVVNVPASPERPHFLVEVNGEAPGRRTAFVRVGDQSVEASREAVSLMKAKARGEGARFTFGESEQRLMRYLEQYERVTVREYARLAGLPLWKASKTLVQLARAGVLRHHAAPGEDHFTMALP
ncbi:MAG TPA: ATP-binding protein [Rubricoccaceae bacterium]|nr:ATP-binding protein [Rubricoccaceae bacterium]